MAGSSPSLTRCLARAGSSMAPVSSPGRASQWDVAATPPSAIARNRSRLEPKWAYTAPLVYPASRAMSSTLAPSNPRAAKTRAPAASRSALVWSALRGRRSSRRGHLLRQGGGGCRDVGRGPPQAAGHRIAERGARVRCLPGLASEGVGQLAGRLSEGLAGRAERLSILLHALMIARTYRPVDTYRYWAYRSPHTYQYER